MSRTSTASSQTPSSSLTPRNAIKLLFAFGDVNMLNCKDGYVLSDTLRIFAKTTLCRKISFSCKSRVTFISRMTLEYTNDLGLRVHVGTFNSYGQPMKYFNICGNAQLYQHSIEFGHVYGLYVCWNASFLQRSFNECGFVRAISMRNFHSSNSDHYGVFENINNDIDRKPIVNYDGKGGGFIDVDATSANTNIHQLRKYPIDSPVRESVIELYRKHVRVILRVSRVRQTIKLQNSFGQKGIAHYVDLSDFVTDAARMSISCRRCTVCSVVSLVVNCSNSKSLVKHVRFFRDRLVCVSAPGDTVISSQATIRPTTILSIA